MKKYLLLVAVVLLAAAGFSVRCTALNRQYPSPRIHAAGMGEPQTVEGYTVTLEGLTLEDGSYIQTLLPGYVAAYTEDQKVYPVEKERLLLAELTFEKSSDAAKPLDLTALAFESGAWSSQFDGELFMAANPQLDGIILELDTGGRVTLRFPVVLLEDAFTNKQWAGMEQWEFSMVLGHYPEKYVFRSAVSGQ